MHRSFAPALINSHGYVLCSVTYSIISLPSESPVHSQAQQLTNIQLVFLSGYSCGMVLQIFSPNFAGTMAMETSALLPQSAFLSKWFERSKSDKTAILLFMLRTMRPSGLEAGIFFQLNLHTFIRVRKFRTIFIIIFFYPRFI